MKTPKFLITLNAFGNIICKPETIGTKLPEEDKVEILVSSLPDSYDNL